MKVKTMKSMLFATLLLAGISLASCKDGNNQGDGAVETNETTEIGGDTIAPGDMDDVNTAEDTATVNPDTVMGP